MVLGIKFVGGFGEVKPFDPEADENEIAEPDWRVDGRAFVLDVVPRTVGRCRSS